MAVTKKGTYSYPLSKEVKELKKLLVACQTELGSAKPDTASVKAALDEYLSNWDAYNIGSHVKTPS